MAKILVVDDELGIRDLLSEILNDEGHTVALAENAAEARTARQEFKPDLVLLDIWMPDTDGVTLLKEWRGGGLLTMPVVMMSGHATIETAIEATRIGAHAFLEKPITMQKLLQAVQEALDSGKTARRMAYAMPNAGEHAADLTVEMVMTGGQRTEATEPETLTLGSTQQVFELNQPLREARDAFEKAYFEFHLIQEGGSMTRVAEKTGLERTHLYRKLKQLGVDLNKSRKAAAAAR